MPNPQSLTEKMMYATLRLEDTLTGSTSTGFIFTYIIRDKHIPILVSNRHFPERVKNLSELDFSKKEIIHEFTTNFHLDDDTNHNLKFSGLWYLHPTEDLAFTYLAPIFKYIELMTKKKVFHRTIEEPNIPTIEQLDELSAIENVVMVGYPNGLYDSYHNLPIFRKGITSSHPNIDFNNRKHGVVDMACLPGSSGSPIFLLDEGIFTKKSGGAYVGSKFMFLGIENAMPTRASLSLFKKTIDPVTRAIKYDPTDEYAVKDDLHFGYYIKSSELFEFKKLIEKSIPPTPVI